MQRKDIDWSLEIPKGHDIRFQKDPDYIKVIGRLSGQTFVGRISRGVNFFERLRMMRQKLSRELLHECSRDRH